MSVVLDEKRAEILRLVLIENASIRQVARRAKVSRKTVRKVLAPEPRRVSAPRSRLRLLDPYDDVVRQALRDDEAIKAPAVLERLRAVGYTGGITVVRERLRALRPAVDREPFLTLEHPPGRQLQVDWTRASCCRACRGGSAGSSPCCRIRACSTSSSC